MHAQTLLALAGRHTDGCYNSVVPPLYQSAIFRFEDVGQTKGFDYTRSGNPTRHTLEETLAALEGGEGAVATTTGMAAVTTVLSLFDVGSHLICSHDCYGGTARLLHLLASRGALEVTFVDLTEPDSLSGALRPNTRAVWVETPSNPLLRVTDLEAVARVSREAGLTLIVDNTLLSPLQQQPFRFGADFVVYSTTKYLNGHSDVVGGAVVARTAALNEQVQFAANALGTVAQPFDCWLILRGLKTLPLRLRQHEENADAVAQFLVRHPAVKRVFYPGLSSHDGHHIAARQQSGFGGLVSFEVRGGWAAVQQVLRSTRVFTLAESLGGVESLIEHPATMSHASMQPEQRAEAGITDELVRLSVGIEDIEDLTADLGAALAAIPALGTVSEPLDAGEGVPEGAEVLHTV